MRREAELWFQQATHDLEAARHASEAGDYFAAVFWSHQATEKALKAVLINSGIATRGHNLLELARLIRDELSLDIPPDVMRCLRRLNPHYTVARYPDAANGLPFELYDREDAEQAIACSEEVVRWAERNLL